MVIVNITLNLDKRFPIIERMKSIVFLFAGFKNLNAFEPSFDGKSAFDRCLEWASSVEEMEKTVIAVSGVTKEAAEKAVSVSGKNCCIIQKDDWTTSILLGCIEEELTKAQSDYVVYTMADRPLLDTVLTAKVIEEHKKYIAEYTSAEGYPEGFAPEVIDSGSIKIIRGLSESSRKEEGDKMVSAQSIFNVMKGDINAFDIEAVLAPKDYRLLRLKFSMSEKINALACQNLFKAAKEAGSDFTADSLSELAEKTPSVQKTVPAFYNVQIARACATWDSYSPYHEEFKKRFGCYPDCKKILGAENMSLEQFSALTKQIADFSTDAVVSLSLWGEPLTIPNIADYVGAVLEHSGLSVLIETDAVLLSNEQAEAVANIMNIVPKRTNGMEAVTWIIKLDAVTQEKYDAIHLNSASFNDEKTAFQKAKDNLLVLKKLFPTSVYAQFTRMNENEDELEQFYRTYHDKNSISNGNVIIQKYDHFCKMLPEKKPADLSPLNRNPCWHLKRDMCILAEGNVPLCREYLNTNIQGNVFEQPLPEIWDKLTAGVQEQMENTYSEKCGECDEYYTFNF